MEFSIWSRRCCRHRKMTLTQIGIGTFVCIFIPLLVSANAGVSGPNSTAPQIHSLKTDLLVQNAGRRDAPVIVVVQINPEKTPYCTMAKKSWARYADKHGYNLHWVTDRRAGISPKMQKYEETLRRMYQVPDGTLMLLTDCDVVVTNLDISMKSVWDSQAKKHTSMLLAKDPAWKSYGIPINSGMIMIKNGKWNRRLFAEILAHGPVSGKWTQFFLLDQPILTKLLIESGELFVSHRACCFICFGCTPSTVMGTPGENLVIVDDRVMNSIKRYIIFVSSNDSKELEWKVGDWTAHITGSSHSDRVRLTKEVLSLSTMH